MGIGIEPCGKSCAGGVTSLYEPRFEISKPPDFSVNNPRDSFLRFVTYCFDTFVYITDCTVDISEDGAGLVFNPAFDGTNFISPYDGSESRVRYYDSHRVVFYIHKTALWPISTRIFVRLTGTDNQNQVVSKLVPVRW